VNYMDDIRGNHEPKREDKRDIHYLFLSLVPSAHSSQNQCSVSYILYKMSPGHSVNHVVGLDTKPGLNGPPATCLPALCHLVSSNFGPKCLAQFSSQSEVMAEVVDERLPLFRIDVVIAQDEVAANVNLAN